MEGVLTGAVAIAGALLLVGFPKVGKRAWGFLNDREIEWVIARINADRADAEETKPFHFPSFMAHGLELKIWGFAMIFFMLSVVGFSFAFFLPLILRGGMGFSMAASQCLITPPYIAAAILMYTEGRLGDRYKVRAPILISNAILALIGLPIMAFGPNSGAKYTYVTLKPWKKSMLIFVAQWCLLCRHGYLGQHSRCYGVPRLVALPAQT